jgi:predicted nucleic acid-binding protein
VTVLDTSAVIDFLLGDGVAGQVRALLNQVGLAAAPDLLVFEILALLRGDVARSGLGEARARDAIEDLGDLGIDLFPTLPLRRRAFELRENMTAGAALFVALAEFLDGPLATKDGPLASAVRRHTQVAVHLLSTDPDA